LQNDLQLVADEVGRTLGKTLGAVTGLEQEGPSRGGLSQLVAEAARFAGEDEWWLGGQLGLHAGQVLSVGPHGRLRDGA